MKSSSIVVAIPLDLPQDLFLYYHTEQPFNHDAALGYCLLRGRPHHAIIFAPDRVPSVYLPPGPAPNELVTLPTQKFFAVPKQLLDAIVNAGQILSLPVSRLAAPLVGHMREQFGERYLLLDQKEAASDNKSASIKAALAQSKQGMLAPQTIARKSHLDLRSTRAMLRAGVRKKEIGIAFVPRRQLTQWSRLYIRLAPNAAQTLAQEPAFAQLADWTPLEMWRIEHNIGLERIRKLIESGDLEVSRYPIARAASPRHSSSDCSFQSGQFFWRQLTLDAIESLRTMNHPILAPEQNMRSMLTRIGIHATGWDGLLQESSKYTLVLTREEGTHKTIGAVRYDFAEVLQRLNREIEILSPMPPLWLMKDGNVKDTPCLSFLPSFVALEEWHDLNEWLGAQENTVIIYPSHPGIAWCPCCHRLHLAGDMPCTCGCKQPLVRRADIGKTLSSQIAAVIGWEHLPWEVRHEQERLPPHRRIYLGEDSNVLPFAVTDLHNPASILVILTQGSTSFVLWRYRVLLATVASFWPNVNLALYAPKETIQSIIEMTPATILEQRHKHHLPPFWRLIRVGSFDTDEKRARSKIEKAWHYYTLRGYTPTAPAPCPLRKLNGWMRYHFFVRAHPSHPVLLPPAEMIEGLFIDLSPTDIL